ncbi:hypothetical protein DFP72DRAFT_1072434 [Ephemerocybe angulata]|uniref:Protein kinase domain-containing protein n=1 Tax=Ephemerocybe angulata TaxID=980116 RepID=A0A8H6HPS9_9AGAR|nr:hypothetical protein DFP72DRAFT_1072434 [Tulosesus angulatus]
MSLRLNLFYPGQDDSLLFCVTPEKGVIIAGVIQDIHEELRRWGRDVPRNAITLYKANIETTPAEDFQRRALQFLHEHQQEALTMDAVVADVFPETSPRSPRQLQLLVATPEVLELAKTLDDPDASNAKNIRKDLDDKVKNKLPSKSSPSEIINSPSELGAFFAQNVYRNQVPAALFNDALGRLQQRLEKDDAIPDEGTVEMASICIAQAMNTYDDEETYQNRMKLIVEEVLGRATGKAGFADDFEPGAWHWRSNGFFSMILELKNVPGINGDPIFQGIADLSKIISSAKYNTFRGSCNFPVVLIGLAGSRIHISIAVYIGALFVSDLLTLELSGGFHGSATIIRLARIFKALKLCCRELQQYYEALRPSSRSDISFLYPHPIAANDTPLPVIKYQKYLALDGSPIKTVPNLGQRCAAIYTGILKGDKPVIIKFTHCYNQEAHALLAKVGLAPQLHSCTRIVGDLLMVVMDYIPEATSVRQLRDAGDPLQALPAVILQEVKRAVTLLHYAGIVFADLRDGNILYSKDQQTGEERVVLVDFDWADVAGKSRYSATLNTDGEWAPGVSPYEVMQKEHDLWQIKRLEQLIQVTTVS